VVEQEEPGEGLAVFFWGIFFYRGGRPRKAASKGKDYELSETSERWGKGMGTKKKEGKEGKKSNRNITELADSERKETEGLKVINEEGFFPQRPNRAQDQQKRVG